MNKTGAVALGVLTAGALAAAAVGSAGGANATCASFFGIGNGGGCSSTLTSIAVAIGENAEAHAEGFLGAALTLGANSSAATVAGALANLAVTFGDNNFTSAGGIGSVAFAGRSTINQTVVAGIGDLTSGNVGNFAASIASPEATETSATGIGNTSVNIAGAGNISGEGVGLTTVNLVGLNADLRNRGLLNIIANVSGDSISISNDEGDGGIGNLGFNFIGQDNVVSTRGVVAIAGTLGSTSQTVSQDGPGINISVGKGLAESAAVRAASSVSAGTPSAGKPGSTPDGAPKNGHSARGAHGKRAAR